MFPSSQFLNIFPVWERDIQTVETGKEFVCPPDFGECVENSRLLSCVPHELFMDDTVAAEGIDFALNG